MTLDDRNPQSTYGLMRDFYHPQVESMPDLYNRRPEVTEESELASGSWHYEVQTQISERINLGVL